MKNKGGDFDKSVDQNFLPVFFTEQSTLLTRTQKWGGGLAPDFDTRFGGIKATHSRPSAAVAAVVALRPL